LKIAFHNRQRRVAVDSKAVGLEFERLLGFLMSELRQAPPVWLKKRQLQQIFLHGQLSVVLVSNKAISKINKQWRDQDKATDVLSFPLDLTPPPVSNKANLDFDRAGQKKGRNRGGQNADENGYDENGYIDQWVVGEVIISLERAQEQAKDYGHSPERELSFLFVHGVLHVFGFDHLTRAEEKEMFGLQRRILDAAGIKRK
jgi:probable rRNA maturation factor